MASDTYVLDVDDDEPIGLAVDDDVGIEWGTDEYIKYRTSAFPDYEGTYTVTPRLSAQVLPTADTTLHEDVEVEGIPSYRTTNPSGGYTVIIAQD